MCTFGDPPRNTSENSYSKSIMSMSLGWVVRTLSEYFRLHWGAWDFTLTGALVFWYVNVQVQSYYIFNWCDECLYLYIVWCQVHNNSTYDLSGERSFTKTAPISCILYNALPINITTSSSLAAFKKAHISLFSGKQLYNIYFSYFSEHE